MIFHFHTVPSVQLRAQVSSQFAFRVLKGTKHSINVDYLGNLPGFVQKKANGSHNEGNSGHTHTHIFYIRVKLTITPSHM